MLHAVIMAGGSGTRFWPASRKLRPKQLLPLAGPRTMIQSTVDRLGDLIPPERQRILTNEILIESIAEQLPELPQKNIIGEPCKRDTAPCIGLAAEMIARDDPEATMVVMPSDHVIVNPQSFRDAISAGERLIEKDPSQIVTFGIRPTYPAESFGYIQRGEPISATGASAFRVQRFREKPDRTTAQEYVSAGTFYWNSGIFMWRATTILDALQQYEPEMHAHLTTIGKALGSDNFDATFRREFESIEAKSVDYAVMERHQNVVVIEAPFPWDDVGSWQALARLHGSDAQGNTVVGSHVGIDTSGTIVHTHSDHTVVTIDVSDLIVVQTSDATLVASKHAEERVREAVKALEQQQLFDKL